MKIIVAHEGKQHSFKTAEAIYKDNSLCYYVTTIYDKPWSLTRIVKMFLRGNMKKKCASHRSNILPDNVVKQYCEWKGLLRMFISKIPFLNECFPNYYDWLHDSFGKKVAKLAIKNNVDAVIMYDTNANQCWKILKEKAPHIKRILDVTIGNRLYLEKIYREDAERYPQTSQYLLKEQKDVFDVTKRERLAEELQLSQFFLVGSKFVKHSLEYSGVDAQSIFVINYGVNLSQFKPLDKKTSEGPLKLLFTGNCSYRKGMHHLLAVIATYNPKDVELYIAGGYDDQSFFYKKYSSLPNVHFLGFVTHDILQEIYAKTDVFVLPSLAEGFAMVSLEALGAGLPIICTTNSGCNDIIEDCKNGFVIDASDEVALKKRINWFVDNKAKIPEMSVYANKSVSQHSWEDYGNNLLDRIKSIL